MCSDCTILCEMLLTISYIHALSTFTKIISTYVRYLIPKPFQMKQKKCSPVHVSLQKREKAQVCFPHQPGQGPGCKACQVGEHLSAPSLCLPAPQAGLCPCASPSSDIQEGGRELVGRPRRETALSEAPSPGQLGEDKVSSVKAPDLREGMSLSSEYPDW